MAAGRAGRSGKALAGAWAEIAKIKASTVSLSQHNTFAENKKLILTSNTPGGGISRLIEFHMTTEFDRPWISWFDEASRHRAAFGYHTTDASEGGSHQAVELKTVADATGSFPNDMRTRLSIGTNSDRILVGFNYTDTLEVNQGEAPATPAAFGFQLRGYKRDGSAHQIVAQLTAQVETTDATTAFLDVVNVSASQPAQLVMMKAANSSSGSTGIFMKRGNGTNTDAFVFKVRTGVFEIGPVATTPTGAATNGRFYMTGAGVLRFVDPAGTDKAVSLV